MIIDCHTHIGKDNGKYWTAQELIKSMDEAGIDISMVISTFWDGSGVSAKELIEISKNFPPLKPIGNIDYSTIGDRQIQELKELLDKKLIFGVKFFLGYESFYPQDEKLYPVYKFCSENNFPVVFHTGLLEVGYKGSLGYSKPLPIDKVAADFPNLKIIMAHFGNPNIKDAAIVMAKNTNVYSDISGYFTEHTIISKEEKEYFIKEMGELKSFLGNFKKFLFGTDWPIYSQKEYLDAVKLLDLTKEEEELVFFQNANRIFNLGLK